jgi:superfamily II DNA or RNA helicase
MGAQVSLWEHFAPRRDRRSLRPYQIAAGQGIDAGLAIHQRGIVCSPTGSGKTIMEADTARRYLEKPGAGWILFLAESRAILRQAVQKLGSWTGRLGDVGLEQGDNYSGRERIICGSRQTLAQEKRWEQVVWRHGGTPGLILFDEGHHWKPKGQYADIFARCPDAQVVLFTATPDRADGGALGQFCTGEFFRYEIHEAQEDGWLVPVVTPTIKNWEALDISRIRKVAGELDEKALEQMLAEVVKDQGRAGLEAVGDRKTIWYCGRVETAHALAAVIKAENGERHCVMAVDGSMDDDQKDEILDAYKRGEFRHLVNVGICVEGFDDPPTSAVVMTRPYLSRGRFTQVCGRALRPMASVDEYATAEERRFAIASSDKPNAALVNFRFIHKRHTLVCPEDILGGRYSDKAKARAAKLREKYEDLTVEESLKRAKEQIDNHAAGMERARKAKLAAEAAAKAEAQWGTYDAYDGRRGFDNNTKERVGNEPGAFITEKQRRLLIERFGFREWDLPETKAEATKEIKQRFVKEEIARQMAEKRQQAGR